jgi:diguanylate cyclase (GGDEF)-like protein/PAS domain S-box-containing protein
MGHRQRGGEDGGGRPVAHVAAEAAAGADPAVAALARFADQLPVPFTAVTRDGRSVVVNRAYAEMVGLDAHDVPSRALDEAVHADDLAAAEQAVRTLEPGQRTELEVRLRHADGHLLRAVWRLGVDAGTGLVAAVVLDVSDERRLAERLAHESRHDALTGLANRLLVMSSLDRWLADAVAGPTEVGLALVDLDRFKLVNDRLGHRVGDHLLIAVAGRLRRAAPPSALVGRMGGDELVVVVPSMRRSEAPALAAALEAVQGQVQVLGRSVPLRASIGVAVGRGEAADLLHEADVAAYTAKAAGGGRAVVYDEDLRRRDRRQQADERRVHDSVTEHGVDVAFRPVRSADDGVLRGLEVRPVLRHPDGDRTVCADLVEVVRRLGHAAAVHDMVRERLVAHLPAVLPPGARLHLPLDGTDVALGSGVARLVDRLEDAGVPGERLVLEVTEQVLQGDADEVVPQLVEARRRGVRVALDRFGIGSSSLSVLASLPLDVLKVDGAFVEAAHRLSTARIILTGLVLMGPALKVEVIMDGIRTAEDLVLARRLGATLVQGDHVGEPVRAVDLSRGAPGP